GTPREARQGDGTLTLARTRELVEQVAAARSPVDPALGVLDGLALLGVDEHRYLPDGLHPDPAGLELIARRFTALVGAALIGASETELFPLRNIGVTHGR
ncbi:MAG: hypothetical protein Q7T71_07395, partial [Herbiconiux sp.]|nr:hypothetical protein [Herbiconiux sp.]